MSESVSKEGINDTKDTSDIPKDASDIPKDASDVPKDAIDISKDADASSENSENLSITALGGDSIQQKKNKVDIFLKATANAPIMKRRKWTVDHDKTIAWIISFLRKYFKLDASESLFLYVNQSFAPSPDQVVRNLYECFGTDGKLILHYCQTQAWG